MNAIIYKMIGAILGALLFVIGLGFISQAIYAPATGSGGGYTLPVVKVAAAKTEVTDPATATTETAGATNQDAAATATPEASATTPAATETKTANASSGAADNSAFYAFLANASVENGQKLARKCAACHDVSEGGRNKFGPALYDVVGRKVGTHEGYKYSNAFKELAAKGDIWTYEALDAFLAKPREDVPGTKMSFRGFAKPEDRADILVYLQTLSASPVPFPTADGAKATPAETPATPAATTTTSQAATPAASVSTSEVANASSGAADNSAFYALLASASVENGQKISRKCAACHDLAKDGRNKFGPALYDIVGRAVGTHEGYKYSTAFKALAAKGDIWTYAALDRFLTKPREDIKGTKMSFRGLAKPEDRADLLAYLQTLSEAPVAFK